MDLDTSFDAMLQHARIALGTETRNRHQRRRDFAPSGHAPDDTTTLVTDLLRADDVDAWVEGNAAAHAPIRESQGKPLPGRPHLISPSVNALLPLGSNTLAVRSRSPEVVARCTTDELFRHVALVEKEQHQVQSTQNKVDRVAISHGDQRAAENDPTTELRGPLPGDRVNTFRNHSEPHAASRSAHSTDRLRHVRPAPTISSDDEADHHGILSRIRPVEIPVEDALDSTLIGSAVAAATLPYPSQPSSTPPPGSAKDPPLNPSRDASQDDRQPTLKPLPPIVTAKQSTAFRDVLVHFVNPATPSTPTAAAVVAATGGGSGTPAEEHPKRSPSAATTAASSSAPPASASGVVNGPESHAALPESAIASSSVSPPPFLLLPGSHHHTLIGSGNGTTAAAAAGTTVRPPSPSSQRRSSESVALDSATQTDFGAGVGFPSSQHTLSGAHTALATWIPPPPAGLPKFRIPQDSDEFFFANGAPVVADDRDPEFVAAVSRRNPNLEGVIPQNEFRKLLVAGEWVPTPPILQSSGRGNDAQVVVALHQRNAGATKSGNLSGTNNRHVGVFASQPYHSFEEQFPTPPPSTLAPGKQKTTCGCW